MTYIAAIRQEISRLAIYKKPTKRKQAARLERLVRLASPVPQTPPSTSPLEFPTRAAAREYKAAHGIKGSPVKNEAKNCWTFA